MRRAFKAESKFGGPQNNRKGAGMRKGKGLRRREWGRPRREFGFYLNFSETHGRM